MNARWHTAWQKLFEMEHTHTNASNLPQKPFFIKLITFAWLKKKVLVEIIVHLFIILFLYTGISKLKELDVFQEQLSESPVLSMAAPVLAFAVPIIEFIISLLLFFPRYRLKGLYATFLLMALFTAYIITLFTISPELPCSCGGIIEDLSWTGHLLLNSSLIILSIIAIRAQMSIQSPTG
jgi:uncharacterized membrane protein YphA (DoxX/SURF4 family)